MVRPRAAILLIGNELVRGDVADANGPLAARELRRAGVEVGSFHTAGDRVGEVEAIIRRSGENDHLVIVVGGLGPTDDDLTRIAAARAFGRELVRSPEA